MTRYSGCGCLLYSFVLLIQAALLVLLAAVWLAWAYLVLPAAGVAWLCGRRDLANRMAGTLLWDLEALRE